MAQGRAGRDDVRDGIRDAEANRGFDGAVQGDEFDRDARGIQEPADQPGVAGGDAHTLEVVHRGKAAGRPGEAER